MEYQSIVEEALIQMPKGAFLTSGKNPVNPMTIGWCEFGTVWGKPICTVFVRESRYTHKLMENGYFTVSVPSFGTMSEELRLCASCSGRDVDKIKEFNLGTVKSSIENGVDGIDGCSVYFECKIVSKAEIALENTDSNIIYRYYPTDKSGKQDNHTIYFGEILNCYKK